MAEKPRVLLVTQELKPFTEETLVSEITRALPHAISEGGMEIRILMPRFGIINERRHRLHEVVRLSGMNIIIEGDDYPLIIKVASLPNARIQVYFLDNEEFFKRKQLFQEEDGSSFTDNLERMVFFCKGALEIVRKFGWAPQIIHCHGWMTALLPAYIKTAYLTDPIFQDAKVVYSLYEETFEKSFTANFFAKASINDLKESDLAPYKSDEGINLNLGALSFADAMIVSSPNTDPAYLEHFQASGKPMLDFYDGDDFLKKYVAFYRGVMSGVVASPA